ncbi:MAG: OmpH family outer membrane protein [Deltaproteobacteria bacterium]|jgi:outer membrane protein|nr:OmpH family outer membrane protein [Deltaproteobacteria bacterium]
MRFFALLMGALLFAVSFGAVCETQAADGQAKIAVINMRKVVRQSKAGQKATEELNRKFETLQRTLQTKQDAIKAFKDDAEKKAPLMSEEAKADKEREYRKLLREFKEQSDDAQFEMRQAEAKIMEPILKVLENIINRIGETNGYTMILEHDMPGMYYVAPTVDITDAVIKAYDEDASKSSGGAPARSGK